MLIVSALFVAIMAVYGLVFSGISDWVIAPILIILFVCVCCLPWVLAEKDRQ
jgi:hypothetical protein